VLPAENEGVVAGFLAAEPRARIAGWPETVTRPPGLIERTVGWQLLPGGDAAADGFYYASLERIG
jgi:16S rRNA C967 or C1407 C5-methylase (RsmB/RsmF family)